MLYDFIDLLGGNIDFFGVLFGGLFRGVCNMADVFGGAWNILADIFEILLS